MKNRILTSMALVAAMAATAGCGSRASKHVPPTLPPPWPMEYAPIEDHAPVEEGTPANFPSEIPTDRVYFDLDKATLDAEDRAVLDAQARWLIDNPEIRATIEGHADERGSRGYNRTLGLRRANAVKSYLVEQGVDADRLRTVSRGEERPAARGRSETSHARNRRAVTVLPRRP